MPTTRRLRAAVHTELPGPVSRTFIEEQAAVESSARTYPRHTPIAFAGGSGSYLTDVDGNRFLDFLSGAGVLALGHDHPELIAAAARQLGVATQMLDFPTGAKQEFTRALRAKLPAGLRDRARIHFCGPTGADAVDAAIKLCKTYTGRGEIVAFHGGFHGSTQSTIALTGLRAPKEHLQNLASAAFFPYSYCLRCPLDLTPDSCATNCARYLANLLDDPNGGVRKPAAVIMELVQGEGGVIPATPQFVARIREITRAHDIPLVVDEIQTGGGRTGTWYAFEQFGIEPDVIVSSKAIGGGHPLSVIIYDQRMDGWAAGAHTGTFRGNQLAFAAGAALMRVVERDDVLGNVRVAGEFLRDGLDRLAARYGCLADVRGRGLMLGVEIAPLKGRPASQVSRGIHQAALRRGLLYELAGRDDCVARFLPPLNLSLDEAAEALELFGAAVAEVAGQPDASDR